MKSERILFIRSFFWYKIMKKDIDKDHDLTDQKIYKDRMKEEDSESRSPCGKCLGHWDCVSPVTCPKYKAWRKKYLKKRYGP